MALKDTIKHLKDLLETVRTDIDKAGNGNKAASQRVRTGTIKLEKVAKMYRKESVASERKSKGPSKKKAAGGAKKKVVKPKVKAKKPAKAKAKSAQRGGQKKKMSAKAALSQGSVKLAKQTRGQSKRPTAKLPRR